MKRALNMKRNFILAGVASLVLASSCVYADRTAEKGPTHPASQEWVLAQLANFTGQHLTAADWAAVCETGSPTSANGCYGNIASSAFAKLNAVIGAGGFTDQIDMPVTSTPNSVFIQQFNGNSAVPSTAGQSPQVKIPSTGSAAAMCAYFTTAGASLTYTGMVLGRECEVGGAIAHVAANATFTTLNTAANDCVSDGALVSVVYYALCVGYSPLVSGQTPTPGSLSGLATR